MRPPGLFRRLYTRSANKSRRTHVFLSFRIVGTMGPTLGDSAGPTAFPDTTRQEKAHSAGVQTLQLYSRAHRVHFTAVTNWASVVEPTPLVIRNAS
jgi:hypothetical protein